jgi:hypothetical protein
MLNFSAPLTKNHGSKGYLIPFAVLIHFLSHSASAATEATSEKETDTIKSSAAAYDESRYTPFASGSHNWAIDVGQVFLLGGLSEFSNSFGTRLHYTYGSSNTFGFDTSLGFSQHSDGDYTNTSLLTGIRYNLSWYDKIIPYVVLGVGFYRPVYRDYTNTETLEFVTDNLFGAHASFGADLQVSSSFFFGAYLDLNYMFPNIKTWSDGNTLTTGGNFLSFSVHSGFTF